MERNEERWSFIACLAAFTALMAWTVAQINNDESGLYKSLESEARRKLCVASVQVGEMSGDVISRCGEPNSVRTESTPGGISDTYYYESGSITLLRGRVVSVYSQ